MTIKLMRIILETAIALIENAMSILQKVIDDAEKSS
jgi:hypothetical protein